MLTDDQMLGIKKANPESLKEIKVKLTVRQFQQLQYVKLNSQRNTSQVVREALAEYFEALRAAAPAVA